MGFVHGLARGRRVERWLPHVAAGLLFVLTAIAAVSASTASASRERLRLERAIQSLEDGVQQRLSAYVAMLRAGSGLFAATGSVTREQFHAYVERLDLAQTYPGIQGIGVSLRVAASDREALVARTRSAGFADFKIWPEHPRDEYHAIVYLEPLDRRNRAAIGYDMFTEPVRRDAMARARDTGQPAASGRVTLVQEIDERKQPGFLIYVPIYRGGRTPATVAERRAVLDGFVYSPFRAADLLDAIVGDEDHPVMSVAVYDGERPAAAHLLHRAGAYEDAAGPPPTFWTSMRIDVAGRPWTIVSAVPAALAPTSGRGLGSLILLAGLAMSAVLFAVMRSVVNARHIAEEGAGRERHARRQAEQLTAIGRALNETLDAARLADLVVQTVRTLTDVQVAVLYRIAEPSHDLEVVASSGDVSGTLVRGARIPASAGAAGRAVRDGRVVTTTNFLEDPAILLAPPFRTAAGRVPYRAVLALPLFAHERLIGALALGDQAGRVFVPDEITLAEAVAGQAATALENARLLGEADAAREHAEAANRTKDEFLALVSHELRTPLNAILGWARMLRDGRLDAGKAARAVDVIERNAVAQAQLVEDLLDVSRITTGKLKLDVRPVDLAGVVEAAVDAVRPAAHAKAMPIVTALEPDVGLVSGDADRLQQVVWNLLTNAIKFTPAGGRVQVTVRRRDSSAEIEVRDTGPGVPAPLLPHVFDRFRQADSSTTRQHGGLGIGLALVKHLVELHGGRVHGANAADGQGAVFTVTLPLADRPAVGTADTTSRHNGRRRAPLTSLAGVRVLAVDDDPDSLEVLVQVLSESGADVRRATCMAESLALFSTWQPDVLLSDVEMPGGDGYALIREIRGLPPDRGGLVRAVAVTAYGRMEDRIRSLASGFEEHVTKPFDPAELVAVVAGLVGRRQV
jgi:signal transduction histidine kinase/ActR/RegA family two-component response regulator